MADVLQHVHGPYALAGLALLVMGGLIPIVSRKKIEQSTRRTISFGLLVLGGVAIVGSLIVATQSKESPKAAPPTSIHVDGQGNLVGNGNVMGDQNHIERTESRKQE